MSSTNILEKDQEAAKHYSSEIKKQVDKILKEEESSREARLAKLKKEVQSGSYKVSSEGVAHALLSYIDQARKK